MILLDRPHDFPKSVAIFRRKIQDLMPNGILELRIVAHVFVSIEPVGHSRSFDAGLPVEGMGVGRSHSKHPCDHPCQDARNHHDSFPQPRSKVAAATLSSPEMDTVSLFRRTDPIADSATHRIDPGTILDKDLVCFTVVEFRVGLEGLPTFHDEEPLIHAFSWIGQLGHGLVCRAGLAPRGIGGDFVPFRPTLAYGPRLAGMSSVVHHPSLVGLYPTHPAGVQIDPPPRAPASAPDPTAITDPMPTPIRAPGTPPASLPPDSLRPRSAPPSGRAWR